MRCHAVHITLACIAWLFFGFHQFAYCAQGDNYLAHARERIWLWEMYNIFCDIEGADKQTVIFRQDPKSTWLDKRHFSFENKVDGRLTYPEFMADLEKKLRPDQVDKSLVAPGGDGLGKPTVAEAVKALLRKGWAKTMPVPQISSGAISEYPELIGRIENKFHDYFEKLGDDPKWKRRLIEANIRTYELSRDISILRQQEHDQHVLDLMTREKDATDTKEKDKKYGLGLNRDDLVVDTEASSVDGATTHSKVNFRDTFRMHPDTEDLISRLPAGYDSGWLGVTLWADQLGNKDYESAGPGFADTQVTHYRSKAVWSNVYYKAGLRLGSLSLSCRLG